MPLLVEAHFLTDRSSARPHIPGVVPGLRSSNKHDDPSHNFVPGEGLSYSGKDDGPVHARDDTESPSLGHDVSVCTFPINSLGTM